MATDSLIWLLPLPPLIAFALIVLGANRSRGLSHTLAVLGAVLSWAGQHVRFLPGGPKGRAGDPSPGFVGQLVSGQRGMVQDWGAY